jgi:transcriptional regulator with XRE-family HTH domain
VVDTRTLAALLKARRLSRADLARRVGLSRQAVSLWFRSDRANVQGSHLVQLSEVLGVPMEDLGRPLPCFDPESHGQLKASLLWDSLYPDLDEFALALDAGEPRALARFVQVYGLYAAESAVGTVAWRAFPTYKRHIHPVRRQQLEALWAWHESRTAA